MGEAFSLHEPVSSCLCCACAVRVCGRVGVVGCPPAVGMHTRAVHEGHPLPLRRRAELGRHSVCLTSWYLFCMYVLCSLSCPLSLSLPLCVWCACACPCVCVCMGSFDFAHPMKCTWFFSCPPVKVTDCNFRSDGRDRGCGGYPRLHAHTHLHPTILTRAFISFSLSLSRLSVCRCMSVCLPVCVCVCVIPK